jgi:hypothetical protein
MKKKLSILFVFVVILSLSGFSQLKVNSSGNVGICAEPDGGSYDLRVNSVKFISSENESYPYLIIANGTNPNYKKFYPSANYYCSIGQEYNQFKYIFAQYHYAHTVLLTSDKRLKENFSDIETPLEKLLQVKGLKYDFIDQQNDGLLSETEKQKQAKMRKGRLGFVAQDLEKLVPEAVLYDKDVDKYYLDYNAIIPVIVEAMKEQQSQIETLQNEIASCCQANTKSASIIGADDGFSKIQTAKLYQNTPNPFNNETTIRFEIPENVLSSQLHICNMTGTLLKTVSINKTGTGQETIQANEFNAGMYLYSLVCDGKIVDTKQMMLTE